MVIRIIYTEQWKKLTQLPILAPAFTDLAPGRCCGSPYSSGLVGHQSVRVEGAATETRVLMAVDMMEEIAFWGLTSVKCCNFIPEDGK